MSSSSPPERLPGFRLLATGLAILSALLAILVVLTSLNVRNLSDTGTLIEHTSDVILELQAILSSVQAAEAGQRGYLLTDKPEYLDPYRSSVSSVERHLKRLETRKLETRNT